VVAEFCVVL